MSNHKRFDWGERVCDDCGHPWTVNSAVVKGSYVCPTCRDERRADAEYEAAYPLSGKAA